MMRSGLLHRTVVSLKPIQVHGHDHGGWRHLNASLEEKVEILSRTSMVLHLPQRLDVSGGRIKLEDFLKEAERLERFELCKRT